MRIKTFIFLLSGLFIFFVPASAQGLLGKSQLLIAYESKTAFLGEVVYIAEQAGGVYSGIGTSQNIIFKIKKNLKGEIKDKFVTIGFETTQGDNLKAVILEKRDYIVFLSANSKLEATNFCGNFELDSKNEKFKVSKNSARSFKMPCYFADLKSIVEGTTEEIEAITDYLSFLKNKD